MCVIAIVGFGVDAVAGEVRKILFVAIPEGANRSEVREEVQCCHARSRVCPAELIMQAKPEPRVAAVIAMAIRSCNNKEVEGYNCSIRHQEAETTPRWT